MGIRLGFNFGRGGEEEETHMGSGVSTPQIINCPPLLGISNARVASGTVWSERRTAERGNPEE